MTTRRMLVAYGMESTFVQTTMDYLSALKAFTGYDVEYIHCTHGAEIDADFDRYDVVFHNYCARLCFENYVSDSYKAKLRAFKGVKVAALQDEYDRTDVAKAAIRDLGFDVVLTVVPPEWVEKVYPAAEFPGVTFLPVLTGYVSEDIVAAHRDVLPLSRRPVFLGYRGRILPARCGLLGYEKAEIGRRMRAICDERGIETDIAVDDASRLYGSDWLDFIGRCRAMLGSESGFNVFDFDGSLERLEAQITSANGGKPPTYAEFAPYLEGRDGEVQMGQVSPRMFECAVMRTPLVLFRGGYSGVVRADEHYIPLEKDFSNAGEVLRKLEDIPALEAMAARTYDNLVASGRYSYRAFGAKLRAVFDEALARKARRARQTTPTAARSTETRSVLTQVPTPLPQSHHHFREQELRAMGVSSRAKAEALAAYFEKAIDRRIGTTRKLVSLLDELGRRVAASGGDPELARALPRAARLLDDLIAKRTLMTHTRAEHGTPDAEADEHEAAADWQSRIGRLSNCHAEAEAKYRQGTDWIRQIMGEKLRLHRKALGRVTYWQFALRMRLAGSNVVVLEAVKTLTRKSSTIKRLAVAVLGVSGRIRRMATRGHGAGA